MSQASQEVEAIVNQHHQQQQQQPVVAVSHQFPSGSAVKRSISSNVPPSAAYNEPITAQIARVVSIDGDQLAAVVSEPGSRYAKLIVPISIENNQVMNELETDALHLKVVLL